MLPVRRHHTEQQRLEPVTDVAEVGFWGAAGNPSEVWEGLVDDFRCIENTGLMADEALVGVLVEFQ